MRRFVRNTRCTEMIASLLFPQYFLLIRHSYLRFLVHARFTADEIILELRIHKHFLSEMGIYAFLREKENTSFQLRILVFSICIY